MRSYDLIASLYADDMGVSMRWPDADYYLQCARSAPGPVLELGCGSGRILRQLRQRGIDVIGADLSLPMLRQAQRDPSLAEQPMLQMDLRQLGLRGQHFALALLPYSLATYLLDSTCWQGLADGLRQALRPGAGVVLDAFVPRSDLPVGRWLRDYARTTATGWLVRHKRISHLIEGQNQIERRYRWSGSGHTLQTCETIRPLSPIELRALAERFLGPVCAICWDYDPARGEHGASHCTLTCRLRD